MGDYSHLTVEHSAMLLREHGSFCKFSNQGFEAKHKDDRRTYSRATNHDSSGEGQSSESQFGNYSTVSARLLQPCSMMSFFKYIFTCK